MARVKYTGAAKNDAILHQISERSAVKKSSTKESSTKLPADSIALSEDAKIKNNETNLTISQDCCEKMLNPNPSRRPAFFEKTFTKLLDHSSYIEHSVLSHEQLIEVGNIYCNILALLRSGASSKKYSKPPYEKNVVRKTYHQRLYDIGRELEQNALDEKHARFFYEKGMEDGDMSLKETEMPIDANELAQALREI